MVHKGAVSQVACKQALYGGNARVAKPRVTASGAGARYSRPLARCYQTRRPQREPARRLYHERFSTKFLCNLCWSYKGALTVQQKNL